MTPKPLYRFKREDGGITVSPNKPECEYTELIRLIAEKGKVLTDGSVKTRCKDVESVDGWTEIEAPTESEMTNRPIEEGTGGDA